MTLINETKEQKKYLFIWDKQGSVATFMNYKAQLSSLAPEVIKVELQRQSQADVADFIRKAFVYGMRNGENLCFDLDKTAPSFANYNTDGTFDANVFFNFQELAKEAVFMQYVREDENHGIGGVNPGFGYTRSPDFGMTMRTGMESEEDVQRVVEKIPNFSEQFVPVIIQ